MNGKNRNMNRNVRRKGMNNGGSYGPGGYCVCVKCGKKITHERGVKCTTIKCPDCNHTMIREELVS